MNKYYLIVGAFVLVLVAGFGYQSFFTLNDKEKPEETIARMTRDADMQKDATTEGTSSDADRMADEAMMKGGTMAASGTAALAMGRYVPYDPATLASVTTRHRVLFFRASWCPTCRALDADIRAHATDIPKDLTIFDVNYDDAQALKERYGVTHQHTLVQVDAKGIRIKDWSGSPTLAELVTQVKP